MKDTTIEELNAAIQAEQKPGGNPKALMRLQASVWRKKEDSAEDIAAKLNKSYSTIYDWLVRMNRDGLDGRYDKKKPGRPPKIDPKLHGDIADVVNQGPSKCGMKSNVWTGRLLVMMICQLFEVEVSTSTIYRTMHLIGISYRKPSRPFNKSTPSDEVKEEFKSGLRVQICELVAAGYKIFWMDEAHFSTATILGKSWFARGAYIIQKIESYGKRCTCFAALGTNGTIYHKYYERGNTEHMIDFVSRLYKKFGKVILVMDNASYHKSKDLMKHLEQYGSDVIFIYQPTYSPDLNPVEMIWKELKKYIANGLYKKVEDLTGAMDAMLDDGTVILPNLPKYALNAIKQAAA